MYIHLYMDFYELFAITTCGLYHFIKSSSLRLGKSILKQYIHFQKGGEGLPCNSAIHSKIFSTSAMCKIALCRERIPSKSYSRNFSERHTNYSSMVLNIWIKMIYFTVSLCG